MRKAKIDTNIEKIYGDTLEEVIKNIEKKEKISFKKLLKTNEKELLKLYPVLSKKMQTKFGVVTLAHLLAYYKYEFTKPKFLNLKTTSNGSVCYVMARRGYVFTDKKLLNHAPYGRIKQVSPDFQISIAHTMIYKFFDNYDPIPEENRKKIIKLFQDKSLVKEISKNNENAKNCPLIFYMAKHINFSNFPPEWKDHFKDRDFLVMFSHAPEYTFVAHVLAYANVKFFLEIMNEKLKQNKQEAMEILSLLDEEQKSPAHICASKGHFFTDIDILRISSPYSSWTVAHETVYTINDLCKENPERIIDILSNKNALEFFNIVLNDDELVKKEAVVQSDFAVTTTTIKNMINSIIYNSIHILNKLPIYQSIKNQLEEIATNNTPSPETTLTVFKKLVRISLTYLNTNEEIQNQIKPLIKQKSKLSI